MFHRQAQPDVPGRKFSGYLRLLRINIQLTVIACIHQGTYCKGQLLEGYALSADGQVPAYRGIRIGIVQEVCDSLPGHDSGQDV